ncbi:50S ribosomal protein L15 [Candidatus Poribacteria bacterium]|nr:50S ribosomal protein L15 [Candidatus Poribacteria bacterium]
MRLNELQPPEGSTKSKKRLGRGSGSGRGKTSGKGHKGQRSRSGWKSRPWFEGGQMPLVRRLPVYGFKNVFKKQYAIVNVKKLNSFEDGTEVTPELLVDTGIIKKVKDGVRILGDGELERNLTVKAHHFSKSALTKIESAGGQAVVL